MTGPNKIWAVVPGLGDPRVLPVVTWLWESDKLLTLSDPCVPVRM